MFICFEGLDGAGKSTLIQGLSERLLALGISHQLTREPGGTGLGQEIRKLLIQNSDAPPQPMAELLLYAADRAQHVQTFIRPALEANQWVLCDRFTASTLAFQCGGRGLDEKLVLQAIDLATNGLKPDLTVFLNLEVSEIRRRMDQRENQLGQKRDRFESEADQFHSRVREHYLRQASENQKSWLVLDAMNSPEDLVKSLIEQLDLPAEGETS